MTSTREEPCCQERGCQKQERNHKQGMGLPLVLFVALFDGIEERPHRECSKGVSSLSICEKEALLRLLRCEALRRNHHSTAAALTG